MRKAHRHGDRLSCEGLEFEGTSRAGHVGQVSGHTGAAQVLACRHREGAPPMGEKSENSPYPDSIGGQVVERRDPLVAATEELAEETRLLRRVTVVSIAVAVVGVAITVITLLL